ncbi:MAG: hypothetical protein DSY80_06360 [Desulfocapsa sp.]|nr:MAG: hypothetical protein DSY80_06360 [Desulfocapsa sp.]
MTEANLIQIDKKTALEAFMDPNHRELTPYIDKVTSLVTDFEHDMSTAASRKRTASLAYRVSKLKTQVIKIGKGLTSEWRSKTKIVNANCKYIEEELDNLRDLARKPLSEWEEEESKRVDAIKKRIATINMFSDNQVNQTISDLRLSLEHLKMLVIDDSFEEFQKDAQAAKEDSIDRLNAAIDDAVEKAAIDAELEQARRDREELQALRQEREKRLKSSKTPPAPTKPEPEAALPEKDTTQHTNRNINVDYASIPGDELPNVLGTDAVKWATAFNQIVIENNVPIDEELICTWFAFAFETARSHKTVAVE